MSFKYLMSAYLPTAPACNSQRAVKNIKVHDCKQNDKCQDCGRQFFQDLQNKIITDETKHLIDRLLLKKLPLVEIAHVAGVSERWLQHYVNQKYSRRWKG